MIATAPAKINLNLRVLNKRPDGFHELRSRVLKLPDLHDKLEIVEASEDSFSCNNSSLDASSKNLVIKARDVFHRALGRSMPLQITLEKAIPLGAGLGGGSSDAASTLLLLNKIYELPFSDFQIKELAAELGSDVPLFLSPGAVLMEGRGERISLLSGGAELPLLLLKPGFSTSAAEAYQGLSQAHRISGIDYSIQHVGDLGIFNDLELPVFGKYRFLAEVKQWLRAQPEVLAALMSGSGSTMFAILKQLDSAALLAERARQELDPNFWCWWGSC